MLTPRNSLAGVGEIVPNKHRGTAQAYLDILVTPWTVFGALTGGAMVTNHHLGFRINWYLGIALNVATIICTYLWYHPVSQFGKYLTFTPLSQANSPSASPNQSPRH